MKNTIGVGLPVPSSQSNLVDSFGRPSPVWMRFFDSIGKLYNSVNPGDLPSSPILNPAEGTSPTDEFVSIPASGKSLVYTAPANGFVLIEGAITSLSITRGGSTLALPRTMTLVPVKTGDIVSMKFTKPPRVTFIPS